MSTNPVTTSSVKAPPSPRGSTNISVSDGNENRGPVTVVLDNIPEMAEHSVSTERVKTQNRGQYHREGGWPKEIDPTEPQDTTKWRKRLDKDPQFSSVLKQLVTDVQSYIDQNNTIDMFEDYFSGETADYQMHTLGASTVAVFKDQVSDSERRSVTKISWHPDGPHRFLASYSCKTAAVNSDDDMPKSSFVWDTENPNMPIGELLAPSPLTCAQYYTKNADIIAGGTYGGLVVSYDVRVGWKPVARSGFENSHYDPVTDFAWLQSKTHSECVTCSTDGRVLWWDVRNLQEPTDSCELVLKEGGSLMGGCSIEWQQEAGPTKYLVGTEEGIALSLNKRPKKAVEIGGWFGSEEKGGHGRHHGPVYSIKRNPQHAKYFMTVGDWSVKLWLEELKGSLTQTVYSPSLLTTGGWSPTRAGVFYACRQDGVIDFWDYHYRMNEVAYSHKLCDAKITAAAIQNSGELMAVADANGTVTVLQLCGELVVPAPNEKNIVGAMLEREQRRERNLEAIKKAQNLAMKSSIGKDDSSQPASSSSESKRPQIDEQKYVERETAWLKQMGISVPSGTGLVGSASSSTSIPGNSNSVKVINTN